jgi:hypothetical protein
MCIKCEWLLKKVLLENHFTAPRSAPRCHRSLVPRLPVASEEVTAAHHLLNLRCGMHSKAVQYIVNMF